MSVNCGVCPGIIRNVEITVVAAGEQHESAGVVVENLRRVPNILY
jgi:hypothetical protein